MPAPITKVNCIQQMCKVVRDIKASQLRGKVGSSLEERENHQCCSRGGELQCQLFCCYIQRNGKAGLHFGCSQNNLLQARAEQEQLDLTTCSPPIGVCIGWDIALDTAAGSSRSNGILQLPGPSLQSCVTPDYRGKRVLSLFLAVGPGIYAILSTYISTLASKQEN